MLNRLVGMLSGKDNVAAPPPRVVPDKVAEPAPRPAEKAPSVMRREAMLGRDQRVAGYTFMLRRAIDDQCSIEALAKQIGRDVADINGVHMDALLWAQELSADV